MAEPGELRQLLALLAQLPALTDAVIRLRETQQRTAQAQAARRAAEQVRDLTTSYSRPPAPLVGMFDLSRFQDVKDNADGTLATIANDSMPCDQTRSPEQLATLTAWISEGFPE